MSATRIHKNTFFLVLLLSIAGCAATDSRQSTGEYLDDSIITTKVKTALFTDETVEGMDVSVETYKGVVQLSGFVESQEDMDKAVEIASEVSGVKSVENALQLKKKE